MTSRGDIAVAIVSYNTASLLRRCLESVTAHTRSPVLVIDNQSTDGSAELVRREFPTVRLRAERSNLGYGAAANLAAASLDAPYLLLLNADTQITPGSVESLARYLDEHPTVGLAGPRLVTPEGVYQPSAHPFPTPLALLLQESGVRRRLGLWRREEWRARSVDWILGAALAIRRRSFDAVGGFDESYFLYQEEVDLCSRLRDAGWDVHYAPVATILHVGGASTGQHATEAFGQFVRSTRRFARRRLSRSSEVGVRAVLAAVLAARLARDATQLAWVSDHERRSQISARVAVWRRGLAELGADG